MNPSTIADTLLALFNQGGPYTEQQLAEVYSKDIAFRDPAHSLQGISELCRYLNHQYSNVKACTFISTGQWTSNNDLFLQWDMQLQHPKLNGGRSIIVNGLSHLQCQIQEKKETRIALHRDYFDLGQLLYENVPWLGVINRRLKQGMSE